MPRPPCDVPGDFVRRPGELREALAQISYFCKGTILRRTLKCGRASCPCATDPKSRHGPYYDWSYKVAGKTANHRLSPEEAKVYLEGAAQYRKLKRALRQMEKVSSRALARQAAPAPTRAGKA
jgi:hypothetical protein